MSFHFIARVLRSAFCVIRAMHFTLYLNCMFLMLYILWLHRLVLTVLSPPSIMLNVKGNNLFCILRFIIPPPPPKLFVPSHPHPLLPRCSSPMSVFLAPTDAWQKYSRSVWSSGKTWRDGCSHQVIRYDARKTIVIGARSAYT